MTTKTIKRCLYKGDIEILFYPNSHQYRLGKERLLSVSGISGIIDKSTPLMIWATKMMKEELLKIKNPNEMDIMEAQFAYSRKSEKACSIGNQVHEWAEDYVTAKIFDRNKELILPKDINARAGVIAFLEWDKEHDIKYLESERLVYSKEHNFVGIFDCMAEIDGKITLIDFKTSKRFYPMEMGMQTAGYQIAYEEEIGKIDQRMIVRFDKETGEFESHIMKNDDLEKRLFLSALELKKGEKEIKKLYKLNK